MTIITPDGRQITVPNTSRLSKQDILELFKDERVVIDAVLAKRSGAIRRLTEGDAIEPGDEILLLQFVGSTFRN